MQRTGTRRQRRSGSGGNRRESQVCLASSCPACCDLGSCCHVPCLLNRLADGTACALGKAEDIRALHFVRLHSGTSLHACLQHSRPCTEAWQGLPIERQGPARGCVGRKARSALVLAHLSVAEAVPLGVAGDERANGHASPTAAAQQPQQPQQQQQFFDPADPIYQAMMAAAKAPPKVAAAPEVCFYAVSGMFACS